ncbi:FxSxx-COOH system tetratricopeptide repeat protein [Streptomyces longwoodensis]|uniref:FxSxx-COOH system tetratricopeptide repeat protein n=1 Tax=Streptomyces longwoodensis TaxID=68231 RepID=UPI0033EBA6A9
MDGDAVRGLNNLPVYDSAVFEGRDESLRFLAALPAVGTGVVAQSVRGLGGVGKSTLVLHHARSFLAGGGGPVWWIDAETEAGILTGLAGLASALNPVHAALPLEDAAEWALVWLQGRSGWLVVFDNAENPDDLSPVLGRLATGQTVITTRRDLPWRDLTEPLYLDTLTPDAAVAVLEGITGRSRTEDSAFAELAEELGCLPLALQQAGAYLVQTRTTAHDYLTQFRRDPAQVLGMAPPGDAQQRTVTQVWSVSLKAVEEVDPFAVYLLKVLAYVAPEPLPRSVLNLAPSARHAVDQALGVLAAYSLITLTDTTLTTHRLVQNVVRVTTASPPAPSRLRRFIARARRRSVDSSPTPWRFAVSLLLLALPPNDPSDVRSWPIWQSLLPHIQALISHDEANSTGSDLTRILSKTASYLRSRGQASMALPLDERALALTEASREVDPHGKAVRLSNLAATLLALGRPAEALPMHERALAITEAYRGPDHPETATCLGNLARTLSELGQFSDAMRLERRVLANSEAVLGSDHPGTAVALSNLAATLLALGRHAEALPLQERALAIAEASGEDPADMATRVGNLARTLSALGRHVEALPLEERALAISEASLGEDHPDTAVCLGNLAATLTELRRHAEALPLKERALAITEASLGEDHPATALRLANLARTLSALGRHVEALSLEERALVIAEESLGTDHPDTATYLGNLASTLWTLGRHVEALSLEERALAIAEESLGTDHPTTATRLGNLAITLSALGRHVEALSLGERALAVAEESLGADHPTTAIRRINLADIRQELEAANDGEPQL